MTDATWLVLGVVIGELLFFILDFILWKFYRI